MKKIKLYGVGNEEDFNYYEFDKMQRVAEKIATIVKKIFNINWEFYEGYENKKGDWINKKINIEKFKDLHDNFGGKNSRIDIFYGDKKMFIIIHCSKKDRLKFNEELFKISIMPEPKKEI